MTKNCCLLLKSALYAVGGWTEEQGRGVLGPIWSLPTPPSAAHLSDARDVPFGHFFLSLALQFGQTRGHIWSRGSSEMELLRHCLDAAIMVDGHADFG